MEDREQLIQNACVMIQDKVGNIVANSMIYETEPWGFDSENAFLNKVIHVQTPPPPPPPPNKILAIETKLGRARGFGHWTDRMIDIDILFYDDFVIKTENLTIPHKELNNRKFVLVPLNELIPDFLHPESKISISQLLLKCTDSSEVKTYSA